MEMLGVYLFLFSKGKFCYEMFDFSGKLLFYWMKPENYLPYYMFPLSQVCRIKVQITCTLCNFCPCFHDSWCKSCWWWQGEKHLLCCVELASEQNREQFMTLYFLLSSGTTLWFSAWFLRRRDKNTLWNQYQ